MIQMPITAPQLPPAQQGSSWTVGSSTADSLITKAVGKGKLFEHRSDQN